MDTSESESFKVLTLNCWGVFAPLFCEKRVERLSAIAEKLNEAAYDVVLLQEVYMPSDFYKMKETLKFTFPYSNYFQSNLVGSGCCIFTKYKILNSFFFPYTLNGYAHRLQHGDWYAGKGVGLVTVETPQKYILNVYVTHTHARYQSVSSDDYSMHRLNQGFELGQFINITSQGCHAVILGGDLNMDEGMLGFHMISASTGLKDAWLTQPIVPNNPEVVGATSHRPDNNFCCKHWLTMHANGERLDYIFYKKNAQINLRCTGCKLTMNKMPLYQNVNYSDHEGVEASFVISYDVSALPDLPDNKRLVGLCRKSLSEFEYDIHKHNIRQTVRLLSIFSILMCIFFNIPDIICYSIFGFYFPSIFNRMVIFIMSISSFLLLCYTIVVKTAELKAIRNTQQNMNWIIYNSNKHSNGDLIHHNKY